MCPSPRHQLAAALNSPVDYGPGLPGATFEPTMHANQLPSHRPPSQPGALTVGHQM
jgi:hypothetical protein